eukprot:scaffold22606_cov28-Tisochrysis_lutea.AAC.1
MGGSRSLLPPVPPMSTATSVRQEPWVLPVHNPFHIPPSCTNCIRSLVLLRPKERNRTILRNGSLTSNPTLPSSFSYSILLPYSRWNPPMASWQLQQARLHWRVCCTPRHASAQLTAEPCSQLAHEQSVRTCSASFPLVLVVPALLCILYVTLLGPHMPELARIHNPATYKSKKANYKRRSLARSAKEQSNLEMSKGCLIMHAVIILSTTEAPTRKARHLSAMLSVARLVNHSSSRASKLKIARSVLHKAALLLVHPEGNAPEAMAPLAKLHSPSPSNKEDSACLRTIESKSQRQSSPPRVGEINTNFSQKASVSGKPCTAGPSGQTQANKYSIKNMIEDSVSINAQHSSTLPSHQHARETSMTAPSPPINMPEDQHFPSASTCKQPPPCLASQAMRKHVSPSTTITQPPALHK